MGLLLIKGILIGLLFGIPAGAVGAMTVQRTLNHGMKAGLLTGLGSSAADCLYACIGAFGLTLISDFLLRHQSVIHILGGGLVLIMGTQMLFGKDAGEQKESPASAGIPLFFSSFAVGITNPAAILTFLFAFSWFGISGQTPITQGVGLVCGVFIGTYIWWALLAVGTSMLKKRSKKQSLKKMNQIFGIVLILFGLVVFARIFIAENQSERTPVNEAENSNEETGDEQMKELIIETGGQQFHAALYDNETTQALMERLPMTLNMEDLHGNEKYHYLEEGLPANSESIDRIHAGDIMLFGSDCLVLFYDDFSNSYSYTRIGHIEDEEAFVDALGDGTAEVSFEAGE